MQTDSRIEPVAVGALGTTWALGTTARWVQRALGTTRPVAGRNRDASVILEMARREGQEIALPVAP